MKGADLGHCYQFQPQFTQNLKDLVDVGDSFFELWVVSTQIRPLSLPKGKPQKN
jgi:hypothetical protein